MKLETLQDRKAKAEERIEKKTNTISKKTSLISRKEKSLEKLNDEHEINNVNYQIKYLKEDIIRLEDEVFELKEKVEQYDLQIEGEMEKESMYATEIPDTMKDLQANLENAWNEWDIAYRDKILEDYAEMDYDEFFKHYKRSDYEFKFTTDEKIKKDNAYDAKMYVLDLYNRVKDITGEVTDWDEIYLERGNMGCVLNGVVIGKLGRAKVESIVAGGYNIQRMHIRVLVKEF